MTPETAAKLRAIDAAERARQADPCARVELAFRIRAYFQAEHDQHVTPAAEKAKALLTPRRRWTDLPVSVDGGAE